MGNHRSTAELISVLFLTINALKTLQYRLRKGQNFCSFVHCCITRVVKQCLAPVGTTEILSRYPQSCRSRYHPAFLHQFLTFAVYVVVTVCIPASLVSPSRPRVPCYSPNVTSLCHVIHLLSSGLPQDVWVKTGVKGLGEFTSDF